MSREAFAAIRLDDWLDQHPSRSHEIRWAGIWYGELSEGGRVVSVRCSDVSPVHAIGLALDHAEQEAA
jgi:hypothetical protein